MKKSEIVLKIFICIICFLGIIFIGRYFYMNRYIEYKDLNEDDNPAIEQEDKGEVVFQEAVPKSEDEIEEDSRTSQSESSAEKPKEVKEITEKDNISFGEAKDENKEEKKDQIIIVSVKSSSSDGRIYIEYKNEIYEVSGISEKYLPIKKVAEENINNYPVVYFDESKNFYFIYTDISEIKFLKINEKFLDNDSKTYKGKVYEFIL